MPTGLFETSGSPGKAGMQHPYVGGGESFVLRCPECGYSVTPRFAVVAPEHCPRCIVRRRTAVSLERSAPASRTALSDTARAH